MNKHIALLFLILSTASIFGMGSDNNNDEIVMRNIAVEQARKIFNYSPRKSVVTLGLILGPAFLYGSTQFLISYGPIMRSSCLGNGCNY